VEGVVDYNVWVTLIMMEFSGRETSSFERTTVQGSSWVISNVKGYDGGMSWTVIWDDGSN
jgi:hypothetical protein